VSNENSNESTPMTRFIDNNYTHNVIFDEKGLNELLQQI